MDEIALHVLDIIQNSVRAGARCIQVRFERQGHMLRITISDDGCGMSEETAAKACSPFSTSRTTRKVGLGLPLLMASAQGCGGSFGIKSQPGKGTVVEAVFDTQNIDCPPVGDINGTMLSQFVCHPEIDFIYTFSNECGSMRTDTKEIKSVLDGVPLDTPEVVEWMRSGLAKEFEALGEKEY